MGPDGDVGLLVRPVGETVEQLQTRASEPAATRPGQTPVETDWLARFPSEVQNYPLEFLCVPVLLWAAFRQGRMIVVTATTILSGV